MYLLAVPATMSSRVVMVLTAWLAALATTSSDLTLVMSIPVKQ
jgi:hypothetical protein